MIKGARKKSAQIRWIFIVSLSLIAMGLSHETWGAAGQVFISAPETVGTVEVAGDFLVEGTFLMTEDDTPIGDGYWEVCKSFWPSENGKAAFLPDYWDIIWWDGTHAELYVLIDREWSPLMQPIARVRYWSGQNAGSDLDQVLTFSKGVKIRWLKPRPYHTLRVELRDVFSYRCYRSGSKTDSAREARGEVFASATLRFRVPGDPPLIEESLNLGNLGCKTNTFAGNPINVATGNKYQREVDFSPGNTPMALGFTRHYNSRSENLRSLGFGWSHTYDRYLSFTEDKVIAWREDGRAIHFSADTLQAESGAPERLILNSDNTYSLRRADDLKETFQRYDNVGRLVSVTDLSGNTQSFTYDAGGNLLSVSDPFGRILSFGYDSSGRMMSMTDPTGNTTEYGYDASDNLTLVIYQDRSTKAYHYEDAEVHNLTGITNENGVRFATFAYDEKDRAILSTHAGDADRVTLTYDSGTSTVTDARGNSTVFKLLVKEGIVLAEEVSGPGCVGCGNSTSKKYSYDDTLNISSITDGKGSITTFTYDGDGNMLSRIEAVGTPYERKATYSYVSGLHKVGSITRASVNTGQHQVTRFTYDESGNLVARTEEGYTEDSPFSHRTTFAYNSRGQVTRIDGPRDDVDDVTTFTYDAAGNLTRVTRGGSLATWYTDYNAYGSPGQITDPNAVVTQLIYDQRNRLSSFTTPSGSTQTTKYTYDPAGNLIQLDLPNGTQLFYTYDGANRLSEISDVLGNTISYTYDTAGNRTVEDVYDPSGVLTHSLNYEYSGFNRLLKVMYPESGFEEFTYDENGNRTSHTDVNGHVTSYAYDTLNRIKEVIQPGGVLTHYSHDLADNLISVTDANGKVTEYTYDDAGRLLRTVSPDTGTTSYSYDEAGNLISQTDANGVTIIYTYDSHNRLRKVDYPNDSDVFYHYDEEEFGRGRLTGMRDGSGAYLYFYDALGNLVREQKTIEGVTYSTKYKYDETGLLTGMIYPDGRVVAYELDDAGRVIRVTSGGNGEEITLAEDLSYLPFGPLTGLTYGNGTFLARGFDQRYQLKNLTTQAVLDLAYYHDGKGNITGISNAFNGLKSQGFGYDQLNRLTDATGLYGTLGYVYDGVGNRVAKSVDGQQGLYEYSPGTNHLVAITSSVDNSLTFTFDPNGNTTAIGEKNYFYGENNRLIQALSAGSVVGEYVYNGRGQRIMKRTAEKTTIYHYDPQGHLIAETEQNGKMLREYFYVGEKLLATLYRGGSLRKTIEDGARQIEGLLERQNKRVRWRLRSILWHLNHALESRKGSLWLDDFHLVSMPLGGKVFHHLHQVVKELFRPDLAKLAPDLQPLLEAMGSDLLKVVAFLARTCYQETEAGAGDNVRWIVKWILSRAGRQLERGEELLNSESETGKKFAFHYPAKAVHYFRSAWYLSQWVMRLADISPYLGTGGDEILAFVHTDHLGTPLKLTSEKATVIWEADYNPFGEAAVDEDPDGDGQIVCFNFRLPGQYYDEETGLHYNYFRYYDPQTGRYLSPDPIGLLGGVNLYAYVDNNPVNLVDPNGLKVKGCGSECPGGKWSGWGGNIGGMILSAGVHTGIYRVSCWDSDKSCWIMVTCHGMGMGLGASVSGESMWITGAYMPSEIGGISEGGLAFGGKGLIGVGGSFSAGGSSGNPVTGPIENPSPASSATYGIGVGLGAGYQIGGCKTDILSCD